MKRINTNLLRKIATKSNREQRHASIIFRNGNPVAFGVNSPALHAEEAAYITASRFNKISTKGCTIVNIRLTRAGKIGLSKPCPACYELLKTHKFRKVIYSNNEGGFTEEYL